jgi:MtrB/PioB family decaheme-associated outer membrane protein
VDERTEELTGDLRLGHGPWNLELGYLASYFNNELSQLIADNPVRLTDSSSASSRGRISLAPDNALNSFHATGAYQLPSEFPARITASFAYGVRRQDEDFLPHTINSTLASDPLLVLPSKGLDGKVNTYMGNLLVTARPLPELDLRARYRYYQHDNTSPVLTFPAHVINDQGLVAENRRNVPNDYTRQQFNLDAGYRIIPGLHLRGGPFWEQWSRSRAREVSKLDEYGAKVALDYRPSSWAVVRADYLYGARDGTEYRPYDYYEATLDPAELPDAINEGQLAQLRKYDEANRNRNEIHALAQLIPRNDLDVSFSAGWTQYDYPDSSFGVRDDERWNVGSELSYTPIESLSISLWYDYEHSDLHQRSRWRPVGGTTVVDDPANNWDSSSADQIHALGANLDFAIIKDKLDFSLDYTYENGNGATRSTAAPGCVNSGANPACLPTPGGGADGGAAVDFPDIEDALQMLDATLSFHQSEHLTLEARYSWQKLHLQDYRVDGLNPYMPDSNVNGSGVVSPSTDVFLGEQVPDYNAHIIAFTAIYHF